MQKVEITPETMRLIVGRSVSASVWGNNPLHRLQQSLNGCGTSSKSAIRGIRIWVGFRRFAVRGGRHHEETADEARRSEHNLRLIEAGVNKRRC